MLSVVGQEWLFFGLMECPARGRPTTFGGVRRACLTLLEDPGARDFFFFVAE